MANNMIKISDTDKNADWIKSLADDVKVSEMAKRLLKEKAEVLRKLLKNGPARSG